MLLLVSKDVETSQRATVSAVLPSPSLIWMDQPDLQGPGDGLHPRLRVVCSLCLLQVVEEIPEFGEVACMQGLTILHYWSRLSERREGFGCAVLAKL